MIVANNVSKRFGKIDAVCDIEMNAKDGTVYGLLGTNGAGKSTLLRLLSGILKPDTGMITVDEMPVYENPAAKERIFYISDDHYFFNNCSPQDMRDYYRMVYPSFNKERFDSMLQAFGLDPHRKINTFSKGMKKQLAVILAISANTKYIFCDETFDGLDPVMRSAVKSLFAADMADRGLTPIISSHNLRELEDICDHVGLMHRGGMLLSCDMDEVKNSLHKVQVIFPEEFSLEQATDLDIVNVHHSGRLVTLIVSGEDDAVRAALSQYDPVYYELLPLTLEEIFIYETEVAGYDVRELL